jgi:hypothetical protein
VKQQSEPEALTQARPATLVFEITDDLQQFVGIVVDPARTAAGGRRRFEGLKAVRCRLGLSDFTWGRFTGGGLTWDNFTGHQIAIGKSVQSKNRTGDGRFPWGAAGLRAWLGGTLGLVQFGWRFADGHSLIRSLASHTPPGRPLTWILSAYCLITRRKSARRELELRRAATMELIELTDERAERVGV